MESKEVSEFLEAVSKGIKKGSKTGDFELVSNVEVDLAVTVTKEAGGKVNIGIVGAGGKYDKETVSRIKFSMGNMKTLAYTKAVNKR